jgi:hypothetical protein
MSYTSNADPGNPHSEALRGMDFYNEDLKILRNRLAEVASKNNSFEACQGIEHFENQFEIQQHNIHHLRHKFKDHLHLMSAEAFAHAGQINEANQENGKKLMDEFSQLENVIKDLRREFNVFLGKWM